MHHSALCSEASANGSVEGGVRRRRRRGVISPLRLKTRANVLTEGRTAPGLAKASAARSFFGPQFGRCLRASTIKSSSAAVIARGLECGRFPTDLEPAAQLRNAVLLLQVLVDERFPLLHG